MKNQTRGKGQSLPELAQSLKRVKRLVYPTAPIEVRKQLARDFFMDSLNNPDLEWAIFQSKPKTIDDSVKIGLEYEAFTSGHMRKFSNRAPFIRQATGISISDSEKKLITSFKADIDTPAILGYDLLNRHNCRIDLDKGTIIFGDTEIACQKESLMASIFKVTIDENVTLPPFSESLIIAKIVGDSSHISHAIIEPEEPRVAIDILGHLPKTRLGYRYILVLTDYFTRWSEAYSMAGLTAEEVAEVFVDQFVTHFVVLKQMHTDRGTQFESKLLHDLCLRLRIDKTRTTAMHPQSDGMVERLNRTLEDILCKYITKHQKDWDKHLQLALKAYRSSEQESTGFSPSMLMFGREIEIPVGLIYGSYPESEDTEEKSASDYIKDLQKGLWDVHEVARERMK
ncbi:unnamed protein product [Mytilus coruscus]|uniref:Integrase catalytic domain-containing protein n=1 Tax=Mytilus coruscus TaxID=42192 RepID=A0A6J8AP83_MYTCO|nr:unnamed protein product [Mytilus coruscus]